ncbi:MAG: hypothetical protein ACI4B3_00025 [Prevotella sp.]
MLITAENKSYDVQVEIETGSAEGGLIFFYNEKSYSGLTVKGKQRNGNVLARFTDGATTRASS